MQNVYFKIGKRKIILFLGFTVFIIFSGYSQNASFDWIVKAGGSMSDYSRHIAVGRGDNLYTIGEFEQQATFDTTTLYSSYYDVFLAKYSQTDGSLIWVRQAICIHGNNDIFILEDI